MANKEKKDYSMQEVLDLLKNTVEAVSSGSLQGTVFGDPMDSSQYDAVAANANGMLQTYVGRYTNEMLKMQKLQRRNAVSAALGAGAGGAKLIDELVKLNPAMGNSLIGLSGIDTAQEIMLRGANGMAAASGRGLGGVMSPQQMATNTRWAATQGSMALSNQFNRDGSVNARFTAGLSLPQTAVVASSILSDKSQYEEWADKELARTREWRRNNPQGTVEQRLAAGVMTENQITGFKNGTTLTADAVKSFNDHIKNFQKEMNGFVASVSKITGSFDTAIDFIQDMTNGKAFSAGREAKNARDKAAQTAANLRVMAADAGIDAKTMYGMMYDPVMGFGSIFNQARGKDPIAARVGDRSVASDLASLSAGAFASWKKANPNATATQVEEAYSAIQERVSSFGRGDADEHNVLLAEAVRNGDISEEEARKLAASGNQEAVYRRLKQIYGEDVDTMLTDSSFMEVISKQNSSMVKDLNRISMDKGYTNEGVLMNQRAAIEKSKMFTGKLSKAVGHDVTDEVENMHKESLMDEGVLKSAGLTEAQIEDIRKKGESMDAESLHDYIVNEVGVNEYDLNKNTAKEFNRRLTDKYGKNEAAAKTINQIKTLTGMASPELTQEDKERYVVDKEVAVKDKERLALRNKYFKALNSGDSAAAAKILNEMGAYGASSVSGSGEEFNTDENFMKFMLENAISSGGDKAKENKDKIESKGVGKFIEARDAEEKVSYSDAMKFVAENLKGLGADTSVFTDPAKREKMLERYRRREVATALYDEVMGKAGVTDEDKKRMRGRFQEKFRGISDKDWAKYEKDAGSRTGAERDAYIAKLVAANLAEADSEGALVKNGMSAKYIRESVMNDKATEIANAALLHMYDSVGTDRAAVSRRTDKQRVLTKEEQEEAEMGKAAGTEKGFTSAAENYTTSKDMSDAFAQSAEGLKADTKDIIENADRQQAEKANKPFGRIDQMDRAIIKGRLRLDEKMDALKGMFTSKKGGWLGIGGRESFTDLATKALANSKIRPKGYKGQVDEKFIADVFERFMSQTEGKTDSEMREALLDKSADIGRLGLSSALLSMKDDKGKSIPIREALSAYMSAARSKSGSRDDALENGYITESIRNDSTLVKDERQLGYLKNMQDSLAEIAKNTSK